AGGYVMAEILGFANNPTGTTPLAFAVPEGTRALVILTGTNLNFFADYDDLLVDGVPIAPLEVDVGGTLLTVVEVPTGELVNQPARAYFVSNPPTGTIEITPDPDTTTFINVWAIGGERDVEVVDVRGLVSASIANPSVTMQLGGRVDTVLCEIAFSGQDAVSGFAPIDGNWTQHTEIDVGAQGVGVYSRVVADGSATAAGLSQTADDALIICVAVAEVAAAPTEVAPADVSHGHTVESPTLTQGYVITPDNVSHGHTAASPALSQAHQIAPANVAHAHTAASPGLSQALNLAAADVSHEHTAASPSLTQAHQVDPANVSHTHTAAAPGLTQAHVIEPADASHTHMAGSPHLTPAATLAVQDATHAHTAGSPAHTQASQLEPDDVAHGHSAGSPTITQALVVAPLNVDHAHTAGSPGLVVEGMIVPADVFHAHP